MSPTDRLTQREREILVALARGERPREVARRLGISHHTVRHHVSHAYAALGVTSLVDALRELGYLREVG